MIMWEDEFHVFRRAMSGSNDDDSKKKRLTARGNSSTTTTATGVTVTLELSQAKPVG